MEYRKKKNLFFLAVKISISALLLFFIIRKAGLESVYSHLRSMDLRFFFAAALLYLLIVYIASRRWGLLLGRRYPPGKLFSLNLIGSFFNNILPGAVGGDTVKIYYLYKESRHGGSSFGSVFLDRYIGLAGLLFIGLVAGLFAFHDLEKIRMQWTIPLMAAAFAAGSLIVFGLRIGGRFGVIRDFYEYLQQYRRKKDTIVKAFVLSIVIQTISIGMFYIVAMGIDLRLSFMTLFVFVPIVVTLTTLPISIAGLGVRESAFALLFGLVGVPPRESVAVSFLWFLSVATASLPGLVEYLRYRNAVSGGGNE